jgi:SAM-dependent methyltransferase
VIPDAARAVHAFCRDRAPVLVEDPVFRAALLAFHLRLGAGPGGGERERSLEALDALAEDAGRAWAMVAGRVRPGAAVLEAGGGGGLLHAFLLDRGVAAHALEPSRAGFAGGFEAGRALLGRLGLPASAWHPWPAEEAVRAGRTFDLVFSYNVVEHVPDPRAFLAGLAAVLAPGGEMVHHTVNYALPYEPHFRIPLVPLRPRLTERLRPSLRDDPLWRDLAFVTPGAIRRACGEAGLEVAFEPGLLAAALARLDEDPAFGRRHARVAGPWRAARALGAARVLARLPPAWATPLRFTARRAGDPRGCGGSTSGS